VQNRGKFDRYAVKCLVCQGSGVCKICKGSGGPWHTCSNCNGVCFVPRASGARPAAQPPPQPEPQQPGPPQQAQPSPPPSAPAAEHPVTAEDEPPSPEAALRSLEQRYNRGEVASVAFLSVLEQPSKFEGKVLRSEVFLLAGNPHGVIAATYAVPPPAEMKLIRAVGRRRSGP
jgi:hypothetical protein